MNRTRVLYHMARADFLERVRRYSFLLTMGFSVYLGYAVYAGQVRVQLGPYRGVNNSAWLGSEMGLVASVWLSLIGFYIVKNAIQRDRETRVGQILATTPMSRSFYTLAKTISNFAVLAAMVLVLALAAMVIQLAQADAARIELAALLSPVLILGLSTVVVTAALAVLFESLPVLRGGLGNIVYFFVWVAILTMGATAMHDKDMSWRSHPFTDSTGIVSVLSQMEDQIRAIDPKNANSASFTVGGANPTTKTFLWTGPRWTTVLVLSRGMLFAYAAVLAFVAALFFDRFDPARSVGTTASKPKRGRATGPREPGAMQATAELSSSSPVEFQLHSAARLAPLFQAGARAGQRTRIFSLVAAELRLMLRRRAWWWYAVGGGLAIACLTAPLEEARSTVLAFAWFWPVLVWSQMGTREAQFSTGALVFSAPHAVSRQFLANYSAGVLVAALTGCGLALHLLFVRDLAGLSAWAAGAFFIPALALSLGIFTGSRKFFEALYTAWWYVGPLHHTRSADFMGTTPASSTPAAYLTAAAGLLVAAYCWRKVKLARA